MSKKKSHKQRIQSAFNNQVFKFDDVVYRIEVLRRPRKFTSSSVCAYQLDFKLRCVSDKKTQIISELDGHIGGPYEFEHGMWTMTMKMIRGEVPYRYQLRIETRTIEVNTLMSEIVVRCSTPQAGMVDQ